MGRKKKDVYDSSEDLRWKNEIPSQTPHLDQELKKGALTESSRAETQLNKPRSLQQSRAQQRSFSFIIFYIKNLWNLDGKGLPPLALHLCF